MTGGVCCAGALESCRRVGARGGRERTEQLACTTLTRKRRAGSCSRGSTRRPDCQPGQRRAGFDVVATCGYIVALKTVAVRELKNRLSAYLREVAAGEVVLVTDRGRVVAELRRPSAEALPSPAEQALETSRHRRGADDRPAAGSFFVSADGRANRTFESDPARRRASRPMTLYAESSAIPAGCSRRPVGTRLIGSSVMRARSSAHG